MKLITGTVVGLCTIGGLYYARNATAGPKQALPGFLGWANLKLRRSYDITSDAKKYVFEFEDPDQISGVTVGSFVLASLKTPSGSVLRPYTPISDVDEKGVLEFAIKTYPDGKFSKHLANLKPGDTVSFKGPISSYKWKANEFRHICLIGGGAGITPLYQLVNAIAKNPEDKTQVDLFYSSKSANDIMLRKELDDIVKLSGDQIKVHYIVSEPNPEWTGIRGRMDKDFLLKNLPPPSEDMKIFVCGPPGMYRSICGDKPNPIMQGKFGGILADLGYNGKQVFKF